MLTFLENQSCHVHQHFEQTLALAFTCYTSVSFAQHGRTFVLQEECTWLSLQKSGTVWISSPCNSTRTKKPKNPTPHNWNLLRWRSPKHRADSRPCLCFILFIPLQKSQKMEEKNHQTPKKHKTTITLMASLKCQPSHSTLPFGNPSPLWTLPATLGQSLKPL